MIIVDVQNCFVNENTRHILDGIKKAVPEYAEVLFTRFMNHDKSNFAAHGYHKCKSGDENAIHPDLAEEAEKHPVFTKHTFSAFKADGIFEYLKEKNIAEVHICGTDTEACVMASAYEAFDLGFRVKVLYGLCASCNGEKLHAEGVEILKKNLGFGGEKHEGS